MNIFSDISHKRHNIRHKRKNPEKLHS